GTRLQTDKDRQWFQKFGSYIRAKHLNWTFWSLNPNSGDTGGLLLDDWLTVQQEKQNVLRIIQYPFIGSRPQPLAPSAVGSQKPIATNTFVPPAITTLLLDDFE